MIDKHMTHAEIAQALNIPEKEVKAILARVMRQIRINNPELALWLDE